MTFDDIIQIARVDYLDDASTPYLWDDDFMLRAANAAQLQACNRMHLLWDEDTAAICEVTLVDGQAAYALDSRITYVEWIHLNGSSLTKKTTEMLDRQNATWRTTSGTPTDYAQKNWTIRLTPVPSTALDGTKLYLGVWRLPLADGGELDTPEIPYEFHRELAYWIAHEAYLKRDADTYNPQQAQEFLALFERTFGPAIPLEVRLNQLNMPRSLVLRPAPYFNPKVRGSSDWGDNW